VAADAGRLRADETWRVDIGRAFDSSQTALDLMLSVWTPAREQFRKDVVEIEANVKRLRSRMGVLRGVARVDGKVVIEGTMTFALGPRGSQPE